MFSLFGMLNTSTALCQEPTTVDFRRDVLPILSENCFACHGFDEKAREADLRLDVADPSDDATAIVAGKPEDSELMNRILSIDPDLIMPPPESEKTLTETQKEVLSRWIAGGAAYAKHWSFEPPQDALADGAAERNAEHPVDHFIEERLDEAGLQLSPRAEATTLLRRVSLDITGLPPSLDEIDRFVKAAAVDPDAAYLDLVDRLLESPHYGERWGRWWLDQARYADSNGYSIDGPRQIWKYRDWVIEALNEDMPFDQFTIEQLAGDLLPAATQSQRVATGFHRNTQINQEGGIDPEQFRIDSVFDRVATTGTVWLGLTIGCAQCHDHKFDPIEQKEYYQLFAFFNNQDEPSIKVYDEPQRVPELKKLFKTAETELDRYVAENAEAYEQWEASLTDDEKKKLPNNIQKLLDVEPTKRNAKQQRELFATEVGKADGAFLALQENLDKLNSEINGVATTLVMSERQTPRTTTVLIKGDFTRPADVVSPETPAVLHEFESNSAQANRLDLARWIVSPNNPLTARVIANRVWQVYFGRGIVETENDFGILGSPPSHPELLDWLAIELQRNGWSLKHMHRLIVTSDTYKQSSSVTETLLKADPNNYLLGRQQRMRLEAELIRDVALSVSGLLSSKLGGPPVFPPIPDGVMNRGQVSRSWTVSPGEDRFRRGLYTFTYRATPPPSLNVFDAPDGFSTCTRRSRSNTPLQALTLLNDGAFIEFAEALQDRIETIGLEAAFRHCTGRDAKPEELEILKPLDSKSVARVLLNLDETVTRE